MCGRKGWSSASSIWLLTKFLHEDFQHCSITQLLCYFPDRCIFIFLKKNALIRSIFSLGPYGSPTFGRFLTFPAKWNRSITILKAFQAGTFLGCYGQNFAAKYLLTATIFCSSPYVNTIIFIWSSLKREVIFF